MFGLPLLTPLLIGDADAQHQERGLISQQLQQSAIPTAVENPFGIGAFLCVPADSRL